MFIPGAESNPKTVATIGKTGFALIGAGGMGRRWFGALAKSKLCALAAVVDADQNKAAALTQRLKGCEALSDWRTVLEKPTVQAVVKPELEMIQQHLL